MQNKPKPAVDRTLKPLVRARILPGVIAYVFDHRVCIHGVTVKQQCQACLEIAADNVGANVPLTGSKQPEKGPA